MLLQILKIISSIMLLGVIFYITSNRELAVQTKDNLKPKVQANLSVDDVPPLRTQESGIQSTVVTPTQKNEVAPKQPEQPITKEQVKVSPAATTKLEPSYVEKKTEVAYITQTEGPLDTDVTYKPTISPCKATMGYKLGTFDTRFGISKNAFIDEIAFASLLWGDAVNKTLFIYNDNGPLTINLIYDERQAQTEDVNNLVLEIDNAKATAKSIKDTYEKEKIIYVGDGEQLLKDSDAFKIRYQVYIDKVAMYNSQGGAPRDIYEQMTKELEELKTISANLNSRREELQKYMESINAKVARYNELVAYINSLIKQSNAIGAKKFTEGRFVPRTNTIDIYQYNDTIKLRRVLAHELGHVLGIMHTESPKSIMYAVNSGTSTVLDQDDIDALRKVCN